MFITFEGIDGCGKTTQLHLFAEHLRSQGRDVLTTREPGGCAVAEDIRAILKNPARVDMVPMTELLLFAAARAQHLAQVVNPALQAGKIVLCDRFADSTRAIQGVRLGRSYEGAIEGINDLATMGITPRLTVLIDLPVELAAARMQQRQACRLDAEGVDFHRQVRDAYLDLAFRRHRRRFVVVDGDADQNTVARRVVNTIANKGLLF